MSGGIIMRSKVHRIDPYYMVGAIHKLPLPLILDMIGRDLGMDSHRSIETEKVFT
jgi:hypothetical protein